MFLKKGRYAWVHNKAKTQTLKLTLFQLAKLHNQALPLNIKISLTLVFKCVNLCYFYIYFKTVKFLECLDIWYNEFRYQWGKLIRKKDKVRFFFL